MKYTIHEFGVKSCFSVYFKALDGGAGHVHTTYAWWVDAAGCGTRHQYSVMLRGGAAASFVILEGGSRLKLGYCSLKPNSRDGSLVAAIIENRARLRAER